MNSLRANNDIERAIEESSSAIQSLRNQTGLIAEICQIIVSALKGGGKVLIAGNGGSAAESLHMAEELIGRFRYNRKPLPAIALSADPTVLSCIGNDFGYDRIFSRQIEALGNPGDIFVAFSTSGNSPNLCLALQQAAKKGVKTVAFLGKAGGKMASLADFSLIVQSDKTERIQEAHQLLMHIVLDAVETAFPPEVDS